MRGGLEGVLAGIVYDFLVIEGYHGHYPSAEEQAEKFASQNAAAIREWLTSEVVVEAAARGVHQRQEYSTTWDDADAGALSRQGTPTRALGDHGREFYTSLARAALTAAVNADTEGDDL